MRLVFLLFFIPGAFLLLLNLYGVVFNPMGGARVKDVIAYAHSHPAEMRIQRTALYIASLMRHDWSAPVPWSENYVLRLVSFIDPTYQKYEYMLYGNGLRRGFGFCSQAAIVTAGIFRELGYKTRVIALDGHVVASVNDIVVDTDIGVILPFSIKIAESYPELVIPYYEAVTKDPDYARLVADIYGPKGNIVFPSEAAYDWFRYVREIRYYKWKWQIPLMMIWMSILAPVFIFMVREWCLLSQQTYIRAVQDAE